MSSKEMQAPHFGRKHLLGAPPAIVLGTLLIVLALSFDDTLGIIPLFAPLGVPPVSPFFHEIHDILTLGVVLYATYKYHTRLGIIAILLFLAVHIPYAIIQFSKTAPELERILVITLVALLGIWIIDRLRKSEEKLRTTEANARTMLSNMIEGCQLIGFDWRYLYLNDSAAKQGQRTKEELLGHTMMEMYPGIENTEMFASLRSCMETRSSHRLENLFTFSDGSQRWFELSMEPVSEGIFILSLDITERKQAEQEINLLSTIITRVASKSQSFTETMELTFRTICEATDWDFGEAWLPSHDGKVLECSPIWHGKSNRLGEFRQISKELVFLPKQGLPGRVWTSQQSEWISDISRQPEQIFMRASAALKAGLRAGVGVPLIADGRVVAVLIFFMSKFREKDSQQIRLVSTVVAQLGLVFQRKQAEEAVKQAAKEWQTTFDSISEWVSVHDKDFKIIRVNKAFANVLKMNPKEIIGRPCYEVIHGEKEASQYCSHKAAIETRKPAYREFFNPHLGVYMEVAVAPIFDESGDITGTVHIGRDITERKRVEKELKRLQQQNEMILNSAGDGIYGVDLEGKTTFINPAAAKLVGYEPAELIGKDQHALTHHTRSNGTPYPREQCPIYAAFTDGITHHVGNEVFWRKDGTSFLVEYTSTPIRNERGELTGAVAVFKDITERKKMQEQLVAQDRLASIGQMVSGVAHEINNPLTSVIGFSDLLLQRDLPSDVKADLKVVNDEARRTTNIVKGLLTFARKQPEKKDPVDINAQVKVIIELSNHRHKVNNIQVNTHFAEDLPQVIGNGSQLQQVFFNIVNNAEQAMLESHKKGTLTITTTQVENFVRASFADDGLGISRENMARLFTPFFTTKGVGKGTGLGLSICHGIITEHGGRIYAESEFGKGATFIVELPVTSKAVTNKESAG